jgi:hypothetical protein
MAAAVEEGAPSAELMNQESPASNDMEGMEIQNPFLSALPVAASSGVLHLMGQYEAPSTSIPAQDFNDGQPPQRWTMDDDNNFGVGPAM